MGKYTKPSFDEAKLKKNPFVFDLKIEVTKYEDRYKYVLDYDGAMLNDIMNIERDKCTRVYVSKERRDVINLLNPNACKLLKWIEQSIESNKDFFWLNKERYMYETHVAYNTYKKSIIELQESSFIAKTPITDVFWLNPYFFFNGNRVKKYEKNIKVVSEMIK